MRALLVGAAPREGTGAIVTRQVAFADLVVGVDGGAQVCLNAGITPHVVVGDFDSLPADVLERLTEAGVETERFPVAKDDSDLDLALALARERGVAEVIVTAAFSGRLDHTLASLGALMRARDLMPMIEEPDLVGWVLSAEHRAQLKLLGEGTTISVIALGGPARVTLTGVRWPLEDHTLEPLSSLGLSNVVESARAEVLVHDGTVVVLAPALAENAPGQ